MRNTGSRLFVPLDTRVEDALMTLFASIERHGVAVAPHSSVDVSYIQEMLDLMTTSVIVDGTNVAEYFYDSRINDFDLDRDIPIMVPPLPNTFVEWDMTSRIRGSGNVGNGATGLARFGIHFLTTDLWDGHAAGERDEAKAQAVQRAESTMQRAAESDGRNPTRSLVTDVRWETSARTFWRWRATQQPEGPIAVGMLYTDSSGQFARFDDGTRAHVTFFMGDREYWVEDRTWHHTALSLPVYMTLSFMHCKNVTMQEGAPYPSRQVRRAAERRGEPRPPKYYVLDIDPMKRVLRAEGQSDAVGLKRAMHICRGHFSTYSDDKPLFGKYSGTFWVPTHVRGSVESGVVGKDYRVRSAQTPAEVGA